MIARLDALEHFRELELSRAMSSSCRTPASCACGQSLHLQVAPPPKALAPVDVLGLSGNATTEWIEGRILALVPDAVVSRTELSLAVSELRTQLVEMIREEILAALESVWQVPQGKGSSSSVADCEEDDERPVDAKTGALTFAEDLVHSSPDSPQNLPTELQLESLGDIPPGLCQPPRIFDVQVARDHGMHISERPSVDQRGCSTSSTSSCTSSAPASTFSRIFLGDVKPGCVVQESPKEGAQHHRHHHLSRVRPHHRPVVCDGALSDMFKRTGGVTSL